MKVPLLIAILLLAAGVARAAPLTEEESAWVAQCVARLSSASDRVGAGAEAALREAGPEAIGAMAAAANDLAGDAAWARFERVLRSFGAQSAADALELARPQWPAEAVARLTALRERLAAAAEAAEPDPETYDRVRKLLEPLSRSNSYSSENQVVPQIAALGRGAVPALAKYLRESFGGFPGHGFDHYAARDALVRLVKAEDLPLLAELLENGVSAAAEAVARIGGEAAREALLVPVRNGAVDHEILTALRHFQKDPVVHTALIEFVKEAGAFGGWYVGATAEFLAQARVADAAPVLEDLLDTGCDPEALQPVAEALADLGGKAGIPALIDCLSDFRMSPWHRHGAGEALNRISGRRIYIGSFHPGGGEGNFEEAAEEFRQWWSESGDHLEFDPKWRRWRIRKD